MGVVGVAGSVTTGSPGENDPIVVNFGTTIENAVVALTATGNGADPYTIRVIDVTDTSFTFIIEEWEYLDGPHPAIETINWVAVAEGTHRLDDGRIIEAGFASATETTGDATFSSEFQNEVTSAPVVLTSVMSNNDAIAVDSDPRDVTTSGFNVRLQQEEAQRPLNTHAAETVGWIAFETGGGSGASGLALTGEGLDEGNDVYDFDTTFGSAPIVVADTQTVLGGDTARVELVATSTTTVTLNLQEEQSQDTEVNHIDETVGFVAFASGTFEGQTICFTPGALVATPLGARPVETLQEGDLVITADDGLQPIRWIGSREMTGARLHTLPHERPVIIRAGALWPGCPTRDIRVSQQHRVLFKGALVALNYGVPEVLVPAKALIGLPGIERDDSLSATRFIHMLLPQHGVMTVNGMLTESFHPAMDTLYGLSDQHRARLLEEVPGLSTGSYGATARKCLRVREAAALQVA